MYSRVIHVPVILFLQAGWFWDVRMSCVVELLPQVEAILREAECQEYTKLYESHGVPPGWIGLRGVSPTKAIPLMMGSDPFYALKPAPDIEIELKAVCACGTRLAGGLSAADQAIRRGKRHN